MSPNPQSPTPNPRLISVDDHVQEHPRVWTDRLSRTKWGDRIPRVEQTLDGREHWLVDGQPLPLQGVALAAAVMPDRAYEPQRWEEVPQAAYQPSERLQAMDADGVAYSVLYPTVAGLAGEAFGRLTDPEFEQACVAAYNDWLAEEWASVSPRYIPQCLVPLYPGAAIVGEIERCAAMGHRGVILPAVPMHLRDVPHINEPAYDSVWATLQAIGMPLCLHAGASTRIQLPLHDKIPPSRAAALRALTGPVSSVFGITNVLLSRILMRFRDLKVIFAESALGWSPFYLEYADHQFDQDRLPDEGYELTPSELFRRQCYFTGWYESVAAPARYVGAGNILWSTNFPLATSTWPRTSDTIARCFDGVSAEDREKVLWRNAATLYGVSALE